RELCGLRISTRFDGWDFQSTRQNARASRPTGSPSLSQWPLNPLEKKFSPHLTGDSQPSPKNIPNRIAPSRGEEIFRVSHAPAATTLIRLPLTVCFEEVFAANGLGGNPPS